MLADRSVAWKVPTPTKGTPGASRHLQSAVARRESEFEHELYAVKWASQEAANLAVAEVRTKFEAKLAARAEERRALKMELRAMKIAAQEAESLAVAEVRTKFKAKLAAGAEERRALKRDLNKMTIVAQAARERYERVVVALENSMENVAALLELLNAGVPQEEGETSSRSEEAAQVEGKTPSRSEEAAQVEGETPSRSEEAAQVEGETPARSEEAADMIWDDFEALWCKHWGSA